jgi:hypothetical protein
LFFDEHIPGDNFALPDDVDNAKITAAEVKQVLESHF